MQAGTVKMIPIETMSSKELGRDYTPPPHSPERALTVCKYSVYSQSGPLAVDVGTLVLGI